MVDGFGFGCFLQKEWINVTPSLPQLCAEKLSFQEVLSESCSPEDFSAEAKEKVVSYLHIVISA